MGVDRPADGRAVRPRGRLWSSSLCSGSSEPRIRWSRFGSSAIASWRPEAGRPSSSGWSSSRSRRSSRWWSGSSSRPAPDSSETVRDILYFLVIPLVIGAALGGQLLTRLSYRVVAAFGVVIGIVGMAVLTGLSTSTPLWKFAFGVIPVGGIVLALIPLGFGIGLTFPVFLLAAQNQVQSDRRRRGRRIDTVPSIAGRRCRAVGAGFVPGDAVCSRSTPPRARPVRRRTRRSRCARAISARSRVHCISSYDQTFVVMLGLLAVAFVFVLFLRGRLPKAPPRNTAEPEASPMARAESPELASGS